MVGVLLLAAVLHITELSHMLPYHLEPDEPNIWIFANHFKTTGQLYNTYPPLRVIELAVEFWLLDRISPDGATLVVQYFFGRASTVWYTLLLIALAYQVGRHLHSPAAGVAMMLFFVAQPQVVHMSKIFKVDTAAWALGMLALLFSILTIRTGRRWLILPALIAGIMATAAKYTMLSILLVPGFVLLLYVPRTWLLRGILIGLVAALLFLGLWLVLTPPNSLTEFLQTFHGAQLYERNQVFQFVSWGLGWQGLQPQIGRVNLWGALLLFPVAIMVWPRERLTSGQWLMVISILVMMITAFVLAGLFRTNRPQDRYAIVIGFSVIWGLALALFTQSRTGLTFLAALLLCTPWIIAGWQANIGLRRPDTRILTAEWFVEHVPEGTHIAAEKDYVEFDSGYGGFPSDKIFFLEEVDSVYDHSLEEFARAGVEYLIADYRNIYRGGFFGPEQDNTAFLSEVETVLDLNDPWDRGWQGPARYVFRIPPVQQNPMHVFLGDSVIFKGYDLETDMVSPGENLALTLYWAALRETDANYIVFAHLDDAEGNLVAQLDGPPGDAEHRTYDWWPGYFDWDEWPITIPEEVMPGTYTLVVGMYDADTVVRLPAIDADGTSLGESIILAEIVVEE